jgi:hypothetical protein
VLRLAPHERRLLLRAWCHLLLVDVALRVVPVSWLLRRTAAGTDGAPTLPIGRMGWFLDVAGRYSPVRRTCLKDALVVARMLGAEGVAATVRIGVVRIDRSLRAHAWVEHRGAVVFGSPAGDESYAALVTAPDRPAAP